jgi:hypothetical protein
MTENPGPESDIASEFRQLGENLVNTLRSLWESPERQRLQDEIENGLGELASTLKVEASTFKESPAGQRLKSDLQDLRQRVDSGEVREELLKTLKFINSELQKAASHWEGSEPEKKE